MSEHFSILHKLQQQLIRNLSDNRFRQPYFTFFTIKTNQRLLIECTPLIGAKNRSYAQLLLFFIINLKLRLAFRAF